jgi:hypothetical protein
MRNLFDANDNREIIERIGKLQPAAQARWGTMHVAQMLAHAQAPLRCAFGEEKFKRSLLGIFVGRVALKQLTSGKPWKHSMPTNPEFVVAEEREFDKEKDKLVTLVRRFTQSGSSAITKNAHPFLRQDESAGMEQPPVEPFKPPSDAVWRVETLWFIPIPMKSRGTLNGATKISHTGFRIHHKAILQRTPSDLRENNENNYWKVTRRKQSQLWKNFLIEMPSFMIWRKLSRSIIQQSLQEWSLRTRNLFQWKAECNGSANTFPINVHYGLSKIKKEKPSAGLVFNRSTAGRRTMRPSSSVCIWKHHKGGKDWGNRRYNIF